MEGTLDIARRAKEFLESEGAEVQVEDAMAAEMGVEGVPMERVTAEAVVAIGGDGTILRALQGSDSPVFGINTGVVGFLTEVKPEDAIDGLGRVLSGDFILDERMRLSTRLNGEALPDCVNEAVLHTADVAKIREFMMSVDDERLSAVRADGIIIATPTGSTCYALSVGSPILDPRVSALVIAPIAPFKLSARPIVVPASSTITVRLRSPNKTCLLVLDGQEQVTISPEDELTFKRSGRPARFIRFDREFYARVEEKLVY